LVVARALTMIARVRSLPRGSLSPPPHLDGLAILPANQHRGAGSRLLPDPTKLWTKLWRIVCHRSVLGEAGEYWRSGAGSRRAAAATTVAACGGVGERQDGWRVAAVDLCLLLPFGVEQNISLSVCVSKILTDILFYVQDIPQSRHTICGTNFIKWCQ
jgi:hypothetical protein